MRAIFTIAVQTSGTNLYVSVCEFFNYTCSQCNFKPIVACDFHVVGNLEHTKHQIYSNFVINRDIDIILFAIKYP